MTPQTIINMLMMAWVIMAFETVGERSLLAHVVRWELSVPHCCHLQNKMQSSDSINIALMNSTMSQTTVEGERVWNTRTVDGVIHDASEHVKAQSNQNNSVVKERDAIRFQVDRNANWLRARECDAQDLGNQPWWLVPPYQSQIARQMMQTIGTQAIGLRSIITNQSREFSVSSFALRMAGMNEESSKNEWLKLEVRNVLIWVIQIDRIECQAVVLVQAVAGCCTVMPHWQQGSSDVYSDWDADSVTNMNRDVPNIMELKRPMIMDSNGTQHGNEIAIISERWDSEFKGVDALQVLMSICSTTIISEMGHQTTLTYRRRW